MFFYIGLFKNKGLSALIRTERKVNSFIFNTLLAVRIKSVANISLSEHGFVAGGGFHE